MTDQSSAVPLSEVARQNVHTIIEMERNAHAQKRGGQFTFVSTDVESAEQALARPESLHASKQHVALTSRAFERTPAAKLGLWSQNVFFVIATRFEPVRSTAMSSEDARRLA